MLMTRHLTSAGEPAAAGPGGPDGLWAQVPGGLRSPRLSPDTVPEEYRSAFRHYGDGTRNSRGRTPVDLTVLPDGLRKEITWCMFRIADLGGVIGMSGAGTVVRMLGAAVAGDNGPAVLIAGLAPGRGRAGMVSADPGRLLPGQRTVPLTEHDALRRM